MWIIVQAQTNKQSNYFDIYSFAAKYTPGSKVLVTYSWFLIQCKSLTERTGIQIFFTLGKNGAFWKYSL